MRGFRFKGERCVVELQFFQGMLQGSVFIRLHGIHAAENHGRDFLESGCGIGSGIVRVGDGVADPGVRENLDAGAQEADFSGPSSFRAMGSGEKTPSLVTSKRALVEWSRISWPSLIRPSTTRNKTTTPR
jgi:hypothetical protein